MPAFLSDLHRMADASPRRRRQRRLSFAFSLIGATMLLLAGCQSLSPADSGSSDGASPRAAASATTAGDVGTPAESPVSPSSPAADDAPGAAPEEGSDAPATETEPTEMQPTETQPMATPRPTRDVLVERAQQDLARRLDLPPTRMATEIQVVEVTAQEWRDASLGCPEPGMMYAQVITPGYQIILTAAGKEYDYRTSMRPDGPVRLCEPQKSAPRTRSR